MSDNTQPQGGQKDDNKEKKTASSSNNNTNNNNPQQSGGGQQQQSNRGNRNQQQGGGPNKEQDGNQVWVSAQKRPSFYGDIALRMLKTHDTVELHGLGNAISSAVEVSQYIIPTGKAQLAKITTSTVSTGQSRKPEIVIVLKFTELGRKAPINEKDDEDDDGEGTDD